MIPSINQLAVAFEGLFVVQDWENYGHFYATTLQAWQDNFEANWEKIRTIDTKNPFDEKFRRMFNYYLLSCKAAFEVESLYLWQIVLTKQGQGVKVYRRVNRLA